MNKENYDDLKNSIKNQSLIDLISKIKTGEGRVSGDDFRYTAEQEVLPNNLRLLVFFAADLLDEREQWGKDALTNLMNSSRLEESIAGVFKRIKNHPEEKLTLILFDLDSLKKANNMGEGHLGGDRLVKSFAVCLKQVYGKRSDIIGRWRVGDEFMVALKSSKKEAEKLTSRMRKKLSSKKIKIARKAIKLSATYVVKQIDADENLEKQISALSVELLKKKNAHRRK